MDHLRYSGKIRTVRDVLPDGLSEEDVLAELEEIREYATMRRREAAIMAVGVLAVLWVVTGDWPLVFASLVVAFGVGIAGLFKLQQRKTAKLEARGRLLFQNSRALSEREVSESAPSLSRPAPESRG